jgi:sigma-E factor negative regulatory protein RseC
MQCTGTVLESSGQVARVLIESKACDHCQACGFGAIRDRKTLEVDALNKIGAGKDDRVHLELSGKMVITASAVIFLIPFAGFIIGLLVGYYPVWYLVGAARVPISLVLGVVCLAASYYLVRLLGNRHQDFQFVIRSFADSDEPLTPYEPQGL